MEKPIGHAALASIVLLEGHRFVDRAADEAMATLARPPSPRTEAPSGGGRPPEPSLLSDEVRNAIASAAGEMKRGTTRAYPPSDEARLADEEIAALSALQLPAAARSALRKIIRAAASAPLFHTLCLLDAVGDPELTRVETTGRSSIPRIHLPESCSKPRTSLCATTTSRSCSAASAQGRRLTAGPATINTGSSVATLGSSSGIARTRQIGGSPLRRQGASRGSSGSSGTAAGCARPCGATMSEALRFSRR